MQSKSEARIQAECVKWIWNEYPETRGLLYHNYNNPPNSRKGAQLKALGLVPGVADLTFLWNGKAYFFELKDEKGKQSEVQRIWEQKITEQGFYYFVVRDLCTFMACIDLIIGRSHA